MLFTLLHALTHYHPLKNCDTVICDNDMNPTAVLPLLSRNKRDGSSVITKEPSLRYTEYEE